MLHQVEVGSRVLCKRQGVVPRCYGTVLQKMRRGVYKVQFTKEGDTENISTEKMEVLSRPVFYFNKITGLSTWELPPLKDADGVDMEVQLPQTEELSISGGPSTISGDAARWSVSWEGSLIACYILLLIVVLLLLVMLI